MFLGDLTENWFIGKRHYVLYKYIGAGIMPSIHAPETHRPRVLHFFCVKDPFVPEW